MSKSVTKSENVLGEKWDSCIADTFIKMGGGLLVGSVFSLLVFKRRSWPVTFGLGVGAGMAYSNCQHLFDQPFLVKPDRVIVSPKVSQVETSK
ncbi:UNVERIFIED_CONTAM: hypothetical protein RMT77_002759 [Armadillidium vulgare]